jgi:acyl-CoA thioesterase FadM
MLSPLILLSLKGVFMNLIFRMLWVWLLSLRRERLPIGVAESRLNLMTLPNDLDVNLHMNNGRFLTICDLSRVDMFIRSGLVTALRKYKWAPIITEHTMSYKRPLRLFQKFEVVMQLTHWDERCFYMSHQFFDGDRLVAEGKSMGVIRGREGVVAPEIVMERVRELRGSA